MIKTTEIKKILNINTLPNEKWEICKSVNDYDSIREAYISSMARFVFKNKNGAYTIKDSFGVNSTGHSIQSINHSITGITKTFFIYQLVLEAFVSKRYNHSTHVLHEDGIKQHNELSNISWKYKKDTAYVGTSVYRVKSEKQRIKTINQKNRNKNINPIAKYDINNIFICKYDNMIIASTIENIDLNKLYLACIKHNYINNYMFRIYKSNMDKYNTYTDYLKSIEHE